jgi:hypothetical protein
MEEVARVSANYERSTAPRLDARHNLRKIVLRLDRWLSKIRRKRRQLLDFGPWHNA